MIKKKQEDQEDQESVSKVQAQLKANIGKNKIAILYNGRIFSVENTTHSARCSGCFFRPNKNCPAQSDENFNCIGVKVLKRVKIK